MFSIILINLKKKTILILGKVLFAYWISTRGLENAKQLLVKSGGFGFRFLL